MFFKKKYNYLNCHLMKHSLHFFYDEIRACCSNAKGPVLYSITDSDIEDINWKEVYNIRKKYIKHINSCFNKESIPDVCENCFEIKNYLSKEKVPKFENVVDRLYIQNFQTCNLNCTYCSFANVGIGSKYKLVPLIKSLIDNKILSKNALVYMSGGEITISSEFEELFNMLLNYLNLKIEIFTNGIIYSPSIEKAFIDDRCSLSISIDAGCSETYFKIKKADKFDTLLDNLKKYTAASDYAKENIILKYIIVDEINDNTVEIDKFFDVVKTFGIKNVRIDVDYVKYSLNDYNKIPPASYVDLIHYFKTKANDEGLKLYATEQVDKIMEKIN